MVSVSAAAYPMGYTSILPCCSPTSPATAHFQDSESAVVALVATRRAHLLAACECVHTEAEIHRGTACPQAVLPVSANCGEVASGDTDRGVIDSWPRAGPRNLTAPRSLCCRSARSSCENKVSSVADMRHHRSHDQVPEPAEATEGVLLLRAAWQHE